MPTELGPEHPPDYRGLPRRMSGIDFTVWIPFQQKHKSEWLRLYFDVGLGDGRDNLTDVTEAERLFWMRETQKRADVIAEAADRVYIIELRDTAQLNAVGRLLGYIKLWNQAPPIAKPMTAWLATNALDPDVRDLCADNGILYEVV